MSSSTEIYIQREPGDAEAFDEILHMQAKRERQGCYGVRAARKLPTGMLETVIPPVAGS